MGPWDMSMARVFKDVHGQINSVDFHRTSDFLIAGHDQGYITYYNTVEGRRLGILDCSKYGVSNAVFTHHVKSVLHASGKGQASFDPKSRNSIRYLSLHDNKYIKFFPAHTKAVTALSMSAKSDHFISTGMDKKLFMWDLRAPHAQAAMDVPGQPYCVMDEEGLVFAASAGSIVSLFDARSYEHGPFLSFPVPVKQHGMTELASVSSMKFSCNQQHLMTVLGGRVFLMDTFSGREIVHWNTGATDAALPMEASFSADGNAILSGGEDKHMYVWNCPQPEAQLSDEAANSFQTPASVWAAHPAIPTCAKFAPTRKMAVTACHALVMWIPSPDESAPQDANIAAATAGP